MVAFSYVRRPMLGPLRAVPVAGLVLATLAAPAATAAQQRGGTDPLRLERALKRVVADNPAFPGGILAVRGPDLRFTGAAGFADPAAGRRLRRGSTFRIASVSKTFTAAAVLRLVEDGRLALDDPIARHLDRTTVRLLHDGGYDVASMSIRQLLQHTSGLYDYAGDPAFVTAVVGEPQHRWTRREQVEFAMTHGRPLFAPGTGFAYSDTGYILLGEVLERATGGGLAAAYRRLLGFHRLRLKDTYLETLEPTPPGVQPRAHQYLGDIDMTGADPSFDLYGGGGLVSTVDDLARFYGALFAGRVFHHPATLARMLGDPAPESLDDLGMGLFAESIGRQTCYHQDGFWGVSVVHCPDSGVTMASTVNQFEGFDDPTHELQRLVLRLAS
jgi:D-alanyl-D-alanine carboxypeptidase